VLSELAGVSYNTSPPSPPVTSCLPGGPVLGEATRVCRCCRRDLQDLGGIIDVLADVERRADELNGRAAELLEDWL
jgi:hypothetical protein